MTETKMNFISAKNAMAQGWTVCNNVYPDRIYFMKDGIFATEVREEDGKYTGAMPVFFNESEKKAKWWVM